jgi:hypothetical protein
MVSAPARSFGAPSRRRIAPRRPAPADTGLEAAVREAVTAVLLQYYPPGPASPEADAIGRAVLHEARTARERHAEEIERRLAERGGWDEV